MTDSELPVPPDQPTLAADQWRDRLGRVWSCELNFAECLRIKGERSQVDLVDGKLDELLPRLYESVTALVNVLWDVVKPQAAAREISELDFARGLDGDVLERALDALLAGVANFSPPQRRGVLRKLWAKAQEVLGRQEQLVDRELAKINVDEVLEQGLKQAQREQALQRDRIATGSSS